MRTLHSGVFVHSLDESGKVVRIHVWVDSMSQVGNPPLASEPEKILCFRATQNQAIHLLAMFLTIFSISSVGAYKAHGSRFP